MSILPGSSYLPANASVKLMRGLRILEAPVRIQFEEWRAGNPLYDWYQRRSFRNITTMQLRKELNAPFFHEYIVFKLGDDRCFRVDRRQLSDESLPLDCIYERGVEAYDTIEEVTSLEDSQYSPSECLIEIKSKPLNSPAIRLERVLNTLWAVHQDASSKMYTLQRYNCYFVAQTIISCVAQNIPVLIEAGDDKVDDDYETLGSVPDLDWSMAYSTQVRTEVARDNHTLVGDKRKSSTLPDALRHLFQQFDNFDQGIRTICLTHVNSCLICRGIRAPFSPLKMKFNPSNRSSSQRDCYAHSTHALLSRFQSSLVSFWKRRLVDVHDFAASDDFMHRLYTICDGKAEYSEHEIKEAASKVYADVYTSNNSTRSSWSVCVREALQWLAKAFIPILQRALECPTWDIHLSPEVSAENISALRTVDGWIERMATFFDSEYNIIERVLEAEVAAFGLHRILNQSAVFHLMVPSTKVAQWLKVVNNPSSLYSLAGGPSIGFGLNAYLDELALIHSARVEQHKLWLKCTLKTVYDDICNKRRTICRAVESTTEKYAWSRETRPNMLPPAKVRFESFVLEQESAKKHSILMILEALDGPPRQTRPGVRGRFKAVQNSITIGNKHETSIRTPTEGEE
ncbi:unnamed protein product [Rhizoctonia solani]|uniref:Uncharacterized protein n=1 Tax=Rhizoctonia solani TaxID=456999 RepID=A0A8H3BCE6_9AGAM|nr:unnamed protein product [Rhizoctonia solani]CAE6454207.1 unnamed protein product [Rhizoctonia solani]